jgi:hypothetical protein
MNPPSSHESSSYKEAISPSFFDFARLSEMNVNMLSDTAKINATLSATMQDFYKEWTEFLALRAYANRRLLDTLRDCKTLPQIQNAYAKYWQDAFAECGEEAQRMMKVSQGVVEETGRAVQKAADKSFKAA